MVAVDVGKPPDGTLTGLGLKDVVIPLGDVAVRLTLPENPLMLTSEIVEVPDLPAWILRLLGFAPMLKSHVRDTVIGMDVDSVVVSVPSETLPVTVML